MFADQNTRNFNLDNLIAVPKVAVWLLNRNRFISTDPELNKAAIALIELQLLITKRRAE